MALPREAAEEETNGRDSGQVIHRLEYAVGKYPPLTEESPRQPRELSLGRCIVGLGMNCAFATWAVHRCGTILGRFEEIEGRFLWESPKRDFYEHEALLPSSYAFFFISAVTVLFVLLLVGRRTHAAITVLFVLANLLICIAMMLALDNAAMANTLYPQSAGSFGVPRIGTNFQ